MKYVHTLLWVVFSCLVLPHTAWAQDTGAAPLSCIGTDTFYPRGDHWAVLPGGSVSVLYQPDGPSTQANPPPGSLAVAAVQSALQTWTVATCEAGGTPNISIVSGGSYPNRDPDINPNTNTFNNVAYWVVDSNAWVAGSGVVALTTNLYTADTGFEVASTMQFNGAGFTWRTSDSGGNPYGCTPGAQGCYDIYTVALHESGHFLGFNHVACTDAVMFPNSDGTLQFTGLSHDEVGGVCAIYPPRQSQTSLGVMGEQCVSASGCSSGLTCLFPSDAGAGATDGWCAQPCESDTDCGLGYLCSIFVAGTFCAPGIHLDGVPLNPQANADLCAQCSTNSQCISQSCVSELATEGSFICTQSCGLNGTQGCPDGFVCTPASSTSSVCWPVDPNNCPTPGAQLNDTCFVDAQTGDPNDDYELNCADNLTCFFFTNSDPVTGACLPPCNLNGVACPSSQQCCFGLNPDGTCADPSASVTDGACFTIGQEGASCVVPENSVCAPGLQCFYTTHPTLSQCYFNCAVLPCPTGEECISSVFQDANQNAIALCCDASSYDPTNPTTCVPKPGPCLLDVGVACNQDSDCQSNLCLKNAGTAACSQACNTSADCPSGSSCITVSGSTLCWPDNGPAAQPACANPNTTPPPSGCSCRDGAAGEVLGFILLGFWLTRRVRAA